MVVLLFLLSSCSCAINEYCTVIVTGFVKTDPNRTRTEIQFNSCTIQKLQTHGYRWPSLLSQMAFCHSCQTTKVHYRVYEASEWH